MYLLLLLACLVVFIFGMVLRAIGLSMVGRAERQMRDMQAQEMQQMQERMQQMEAEHAGRWSS